MNLSEINTVQDLITSNKDSEPGAEILKLIWEEDPQVGLNIAKEIVINLQSLHEEVAKMMVDDENTDSAFWMRDALILESTLKLLDEIALWPNK